MIPARLQPISVPSFKPAMLDDCLQYIQRSLGCLSNNIKERYGDISHRYNNNHPLHIQALIVFINISSLTDSIDSIY